MSVLTEYDEAKTMQAFYDEGYAEGYAEVSKEFLLYRLVQREVLSLADAAAELNIGESEFRANMIAAGY